MSRPYPYTNLNWRDQTNRWDWSTKYAEWLSLAEQNRNHRFTALERSLACKPGYTETKPASSPQ